MPLIITIIQTMQLKFFNLALIHMLSNELGEGVHSPPTMEGRGPGGDAPPTSVTSSFGEDPPSLGVSKVGIVCSCGKRLRTGLAANEYR